MPNAKSNLKLTGDTHLPDVESDLDIEEGTSSLARLAQERGQSRRPLVRRAGVLLAPDSDTGLNPTAGVRDASTSRQTRDVLPPPAVMRPPQATAAAARGPSGSRARARPMRCGWSPSARRGCLSNCCADPGAARTGWSRAVESPQGLP